MPGSACILRALPLPLPVVDRVKVDGNAGWKAAYQKMQFVVRHAD
jgi:hypothetical protein